jgi:hypothetical protein
MARRQPSARARNSSSSPDFRLDEYLGIHLSVSQRDAAVNTPIRVRPLCLRATYGFFGRYIEVTPHSRLVWTNDEGGEDGRSCVTFEERGVETLVVMHDLSPSKEALDGAIASGSTGGFSETFEQLDELLVARAASVGRS